MEHENFTARDFVKLAQLLWHNGLVITATYGRAFLLAVAVLFIIVASVEVAPPWPIGTR